MKADTSHFVTITKRPAWFGHLCYAESYVVQSVACYWMLYKAWRAWGDWAGIIGLLLLGGSCLLSARYARRPR